MKLDKLLVVIDAGQDSHPALERAAWLVRRTGATLHVLLVDHGSTPGARLIDNAPQDDAHEALLEERGQWLDDLLTPLRDEGVTLQQEVRLSKHLHETVLEVAAGLQPDVVLKSAAHNNALRRLLLTDSCWQMMRHCPFPLWLVHHAQWRGRNVCTAVDPLHKDGKPAALDQQLLSTSLTLSSTLGLRPHVVHCHLPLPRTRLDNREFLASQRQLAPDDAHHHPAFAALIREHGIDNDAAYLLEGAPENTLPRFVQKQQIDLLVMGAVARGRLDTILIGHTAERLFESVDCDLLVVKLPDEK